MLRLHNASVNEPLPSRCQKSLWIGEAFSAVPVGRLEGWGVAPAIASHALVPGVESPSLSPKGFHWVGRSFTWHEGCSYLSPSPHSPDGALDLIFQALFILHSGKKKRKNRLFFLCSLETRNRQGERVTQDSEAEITLFIWNLILGENQACPGMNTQNVSQTGLSLSYLTCTSPWEKRMPSSDHHMGCQCLKHAGCFLQQLPSWRALTFSRKKNCLCGFELQCLFLL